MIERVRNIHALLIQVREVPHVAAHERDCFLERCGFDAGRFRTFDLINHPQIRWSDVAEADVVIIGGAAAYSATEDHDFTQPLTEVAMRLVDADRPVFGSCWGHQFLARAFGGQVVTDEETEEVGSFDIYVTPAGYRDPLFHDFPEFFLAHMGHHDRISRMPEGFVELAYSVRCRNQVIRIAGKPVYGSQFHAEMSKQRLIERLEYYRDSYIPSDDEFENLKRAPLETPEADRILQRFLEECVL